MLGKNNRPAFIKCIFCTLWLVMMAHLTVAQPFEIPAHKGRSKENLGYWKNKPPHLGYWQQDVHYVIDAIIDDSTDIITVPYYQLTYFNNSPHTLHEVYFHVYQNAFQPHSHYHGLFEANHLPVTFGKYEKQGLGTIIDSISVDGKNVATTLNNTVLKVDLPTPLLPGDSIVVFMQFKTYFDTGSMRRRMKTFNVGKHKHYDGVHWYPSIAVFDRKGGWDTDQHLDKEFYNDFGTFDVQLNFPEKYIVEATGLLQNTDDVLPDSLRKAIDLSNFKKPNSTPYIYPSTSSSTKKWRYHADNVHNFAFTADPTYRIGEITWNNIKIITLAQEANASKWQPSGEFTKKVIETYSRDFGPYRWPKIIIADAQDGMEYPMLTLDGGVYPSHQSLLAHEVGHMWFYGMLGSNETYRAMLDEGFTQFITVWSMDRITGEVVPKKDRSTYVNRFIAPTQMRMERLYNPYVSTFWEGYDMPMNTHSNDFNGAIRHGGSYGLVYFKTGTMLYNLKYVLGDSLFLKAMQHYVRKWTFAHPYPEDFREAIEEYTGVNLNWFFDQWLETTKHIDYKIHRPKKVNKEYQIKISRKGSMQMPIDLTITTKDGNRLNYHIPNQWFVKESKSTTLPSWTGWGKLHPTYTFSIPSSSPIKKIEIDTTQILADVNMTNNTWKRHRTLQIDHRINNPANWKHSEHFIRPDAWYNGVDGIQIGLNIKGNYVKQQAYDATIWMNSTLANQGMGSSSFPISANVNLRNNAWKILPQLTTHVNLLANNGLYRWSGSLVKVFRKQDSRNPFATTVRISHSWMIRPDSSSLNYVYNQWWQINAWNNQFKLELERTYLFLKAKGSGKSVLRIATPGIGSGNNYSFIETECIHKLTLKKIDFRTRCLVRQGIGLAPIESQLYLHGASPSEWANSKYFRSRGIISDELMQNNTIGAHAFGGLNIRGYVSGYFINNQFMPLSNTSGASINLEIGIEKLLGIKSTSLGKNLEWQLYGFNDTGYLSNQIWTSAGIGNTLVIKFGRLDIPPITLRADIPMYTNQTQYAQKLVLGFQKTL